MNLQNNKKFKPGDIIKVFTKDTGTTKVHATPFEGTVIATRGQKNNATFTVRKIASNRVAVERIFALNSPSIEKIDLIKSTRVRRAKLYYLRNKNVAAKFKH